MKYLFIGANSELVINYVKNFYTHEDYYIFVSFDLKKLKRSFSFLKDIDKDLKNNYVFHHVDSSNKYFIKNIMNIFNKYKPSCIFISMAKYSNHDRVNYNKNLIEQLYRINLISIVNFLSLLASERKNTNLKVILFGSVSSLFGRNQNVIYASAKRALNSYIESLITSNLKFKIYYYILGFIDVSKTRDKRINLPLTPLNKVSYEIHNTINKSPASFVKYLPFYWYFVSIILNLLPIKIKKLLLRVNV